VIRTFAIRQSSAVPARTARVFVFVGVRPDDRVTGIAEDNPGNTIGNLFC